MTTKLKKKLLYLRRLRSKSEYKYAVYNPVLDKFDLTTRKSWADKKAKELKQSKWITKRSKKKIKVYKLRR